MTWYDVCNNCYIKPDGTYVMPEKLYERDLRVTAARVAWTEANPDAKFFPIFLYSMEPIE
jgi:hypothetical protein